MSPQQQLRMNESSSGGQVQHPVSEQDNEAARNEKNAEALVIVNDLDLSPPPAPPNYVLYKEHMKLKPSAWLPGNKFPTFLIIDGWRYAREEDVMIPSATVQESHQSTNGVNLRRRPSEEGAPLATIIHRANIRQYEYTGNAQEDLRALRRYLDRFNKAMYVLENDWSAADYWTMRQHISIARDDLNDEIEVLRREIDDPDLSAYTGFDEFDMGLPRLAKGRPKGYKWICKI